MQALLAQYDKYCEEQEQGQEHAGRNGMEGITSIRTSTGPCASAGAGTIVSYPTRRDAVLSNPIRRIFQDITENYLGDLISGESYKRRITHTQTQSEGQLSVPVPVPANIGDIRAYGITNPTTEEYEFVPEMFLVQYKVKYAFQQEIVNTQMFSSYVEDFNV
jgi:hypothetical protein